MYMFQNYIFDLYGTLIDIWTDENDMSFWEEVVDIYSSQGAFYNEDELKKDYLSFVKEEQDKVHELHPTFKYIDIDLKLVFKKLYNQKNIVVNDDIILQTAIAFRKASTKHIFLYDGVRALLDQLKDKNKNIYLLTNAQSCFTLTELDELDLTKYFKGMLISSDTNCSKPDVEFYKLLFEKYNLKKEESIMIGNDWKTDIAGANLFGIKSLYIHQYISPPIEGVDINSTWSILDGDVNKIRELILK